MEIAKKYGNCILSCRFLKYKHKKEKAKKSFKKYLNESFYHYEYQQIFVTQNSSFLVVHKIDTTIFLKYYSQ